MAVEIYLGNPPAHIAQWIKDHSGPAGHSETRFTLQNGTVETYNITGTLDRQWMAANGFFDESEWAWTKTITQADIGNTVTSIGNQAFEYCSGLTSVTIPNTVTSIEYAAFSYCTGLMSVMIPSSVTRIGTQTFSGCSGLTSVTIPDGVMSIGEQAFDSCTNLMSVTFLGKTPEQVQNIEDGYGNKYHPWGIDKSIIHVA